ncbi:MAG: alpha/beta hydrolase [Pseudomonadota bacterium]
MFEGFAARRIDLPGGHVFARIGGDGPPLLLLHGYPQTSAMWHRVAPALAKNHTVICADLRGYGASSKPVSAPDHAPYSKRAMGADLFAAMDALGFDRFAIGAHDRGARVAHRMAADAPERLTRLAVLDIAPTREMYAETTDAFARAYWHWFWLIQPAPMPEDMIGADPERYWRLKCGRGSAGLGIFAEAALAEYLAAFRDPACIHASCEDYRAAASIDIAHDNAEAGKLPMPLLVNWGTDGVVGRVFDVLALWRARAQDVQGGPIKGGHYLAEENPSEVLDAWTAFFA